MKASWGTDVSRDMQCQREQRLGVTYGLGSSSAVPYTLSLGGQLEPGEPHTLVHLGDASVKQQSESVSVVTTSCPQSFPSGCSYQLHVALLWPCQRHCSSAFQLLVTPHGLVSCYYWDHLTDEETEQDKFSDLTQILQLASGKVRIKTWAVRTQNPSS